NPDRGIEAYDRRSAEQRTWDVIDAVRTVADGRGVSMAQVALASGGGETPHASRADSAFANFLAN
ncbi:MAG: hypothetical protein R6U98_30465, partial [Pirellulaceae bacterium]